MNSISQQVPTPRLLMEISKNDEVPKLVSIYDSLPEGKCLGRKSLVVPRKERDINPEMAELRLSLQRERHENEELNLLIKELTVKTDKLKEVNENLIVRIREIENSYHTLRADLERENQSEKRKLKQDIYKDIEQYLKEAIMAFMEDLRTEKMTPRMESKVEGFMEQMMQINAISVENLGKREHKESLSKENQKLANSINTIIEQEHKSLEKRNIDQARYQNSPALSRSPYRESSPQPTRQQYTTIMSKLANGYTVANGYTLANGYGVPNGHTLKSSHYVEQGRRQSSLPKRKLEQVYATTPQRRKKIFD